MLECLISSLSIMPIQIEYMKIDLLFVTAKVHLEEGGNTKTIAWNRTMDVSNGEHNNFQVSQALS
jgi:hypothetical protein